MSLLVIFIIKVSCMLMELSVKYKQKTGVNNNLILLPSSMLKSDCLQHFSFIKIAGTNIHYQNRAPWSSTEIKAYCSYINEIISPGRRDLKLRKQDFKQMSRRVKSRNANQCRIFHLKMSKTIGSIETISDFFNNKHNLLLNSQYTAFSQKKQVLSQTEEKQQSNFQTNDSLKISDIQKDSLIETKTEVLELAFLSGIKLYDQYTWIDQIEEFVTCIANRNWLEEMQ